MTSPFAPDLWHEVEGFDFTDITYHRANEAPVVRIAFDRPEVRNAFRPHTVDELYAALDHARISSDVGAVLVTGTGRLLRMEGGRSAAVATNGSAAQSATSTTRRQPIKG